MTETAGPVWTGELFLGLHEQLIDLLRGLSSKDWNQSTGAGQWRVRDVAAHILDASARRLSSLRDGYRPPRRGEAISSYRALVEHIDRVNAEWIAACHRLSPLVILDLLDLTGSQLAAIVPSVDPNAPGGVGVVWAGEWESRAWLDIGREYTEYWHHQDQIREAVGASPLREVRWLRPVLEISMWALPYAYRDAAGEPGESVVFVAEGEGGGAWTLARELDRWTLWTGMDSRPRCQVHVEALTMARLLLHRLKPNQIWDQVRFEGPKNLVEPFVHARAVMV